MKLAGRLARTTSTVLHPEPVLRPEPVCLRPEPVCLRPEPVEGPGKARSYNLRPGADLNGRAPLLLGSARQYDAAPVLAAFEAGLQQIRRERVGEAREQGMVQLADEIRMVGSQGFERTVGQSHHASVAARLVRMFGEDSDNDVEGRIGR